MRWWDSLVVVLVAAAALCCAEHQPSARVVAIDGTSAAPGTVAPAPPWQHGALRASEDGHGFSHADGTPFFWLGDTAWDLFHRFNREEAEQYLENRRQKAFTVIQASILAPAYPVSLPNPYGDRPLLDRDPTRPDVTDGADPNDDRQYDFWDHVDAIVAMAEAKGLYVAMLPAFAYHVTGYRDLGVDAVFTFASAHAYGRYVGARYGGFPNVIWVLGGDRPVVWEGVSYLDFWREMVAGIHEGAGSELLVTYHPGDRASSSASLHDEPWLDVNMVQSGHGARDRDTWALVAADYARSPARPVIDGEPNYEDHPINWRRENGYFRDHDVRKQAYRSVLAGGAGLTYGHQSVWQKFVPGEPGVGWPDRSWLEGMDRPGATHMTHLRRLIESRPMALRIPDQGLLAAAPEAGARHVRAARASDGSYAFVYIPTGSQTVSIQMAALAGTDVTAWWYDPRTGAAAPAGRFTNQGVQDFTTPPTGPDWVLVLDDTARGFDAPGRVDAGG
jgi:hypothetical protein